jgi:hypothetical protein
MFVFIISIHLFRCFNYIWSFMIIRIQDNNVLWTANAYFQRLCIGHVFIISYYCFIKRSTSLINNRQHELGTWPMIIIVSCADDICLSLLLCLLLLIHVVLFCYTDTHVFLFYTGQCWIVFNLWVQILLFSLQFVLL